MKKILACAMLALLAAPSAYAAPIVAIGVESQYANIIAQVGGAYVTVTAIETDPNTDPHSFEVSPSIAAVFAKADLVVENGLGYDGWADRLLAASPSPTRLVVNAQILRGLPDDTANPHLWYNPATMPLVADTVARDLAVLDPAHAALFQANAERFKASLQPWKQAIAAFKARYPGIAVAVTEPVSNYLLDAIGADIRTPFALQAAIMNGTDPAPQDVTAQTSLLTPNHAKIFVYNQQVTDPLTQSFLAQARQNHIPVVGVYETMPTGMSYQSWMLAEVNALTQAACCQISTQTLAGAPP
jgi:zinc/manganese transport system substrate-binding protein